MSIKALVLDEKAVEGISAAQIEEDWFGQFLLPHHSNLRRIEIRTGADNRIVYILSKQPAEESKLLIINTRGEGIGGIRDPNVVFPRILSVAHSVILGNSMIPRYYQPYRQDNRLSIFAYNYYGHMRRGEGARLYFSRADNNCFLYSVTDQQNFERVTLPDDLYKDAVDGFTDAVLSDVEDEGTGDEGSFGIVLNDFIGKSFIQGGSIEEWCNHRLTLEQRKFIDAPINIPIRLKGFAGTGKTQCLAIKCLKELFSAEDKNRKIKIGFITHSFGVAHEVVEGMMAALDPEDRRKNLESARLWLGTLYELAKKMLQYDLRSKQITPFSLDGVRGREEQEEYIELAVGDCCKEPYFKNILSECSDHIRDEIQATQMDRRFLNELANEIACVLDSEGVRKSDADKVQRYLSGKKREQWMMDLPSEADRKAVLEIHDKYINYLLESNVINMDQMIADFYRYLNSNEWMTLLKQEDGFDLILVDEFHYFNKSEQTIFHPLIREMQEQGRVPLFMAYDLKQSTDDRALSAGGAGRFFRTLRTGGSELISLTKIFRSTPQIAALLESIDGAFPALDLEGDWQTYNGESQQQNGDIPDLRIYENEEAMLDGIVGEAQRYSYSGSKNAVVLCMSGQLFLIYAEAGRIAKKISVLESNTDLSPIRYAGNRCIFSMPDNVAGLQFDRVYVINVDKQVLDDKNISQGEHRRLLSRLYLGASRASRYLTFAATEERGGYSEILQTPLDNGVLVLRSTEKKR